MTGTGAGSCDRAVGRIGVTAILVVTLIPLAYAPAFMFPYVVPRALLVRSALGMGAGALLWILGTRRLVALDLRDPLLLALVAATAISLVTGAAGPAPQNSLFGGFERMWGSVQWVYLTLFYVLLRTFLGDSRWRLVLRIALFVAIGVAAFALFEFVVERSYPAFEGRSIVSTLGNSGYLASYLLLAAGTAVIVFERYCESARPVTYGATILAVFGGVIVLSGNRASFIGAVLGVSAGLLFLLGSRSGQWKDIAVWLSAGLLGIVVALGIGWLLMPDVVLGIPVLRRLVLLDPSTGSLAARFGTWEAGLKGFAARPLLGWGPENFDLAYTRFGDLAMHRLDLNQLAAGSLEFSRAHNVLVGALTESGAAGLAAYLSVWLSFFATWHRAWKEDRLTDVEAGALLAASVGYFVYLQFWFEDHSSVVLFITLAAYLRYRRSERLLFKTGSAERLVIRRRAFWGTASLGVVLLALWMNGRTALASNEVYRAHTAAELDPKVEHYETARRLDVPEQQSIATEFASAMAALGLQSASGLRSSDSLRAIYSRGVEGADRALAPVARRNPLDARVDAARGRLAAGAALVFAGKEIRATTRRTLRSAIEKSPRLLEYRHSLANFEALFGNREAAREELRKALSVYDGYGRTYYMMSRLSETIGDSASLSWLRKSFWLDFYPEQHGYLRGVVDTLVQRGQPEKAASLLREYVASRYLPELWEKRDPFAAERKEFLENLTAEVGPGGREDRPYQIWRKDLPLLSMWPRASAAAGDCQGATSAMALLLNGLRKREGTESLRPVLASQLNRLRERCSATSQE